LASITSICCSCTNRCPAASISRGTRTARSRSCPQTAGAGGFITGSAFLMEGGVTAAYWYGGVADVRTQ
jgi:hypothetical protein